MVRRASAASWFAPSGRRSFAPTAPTGRLVATTPSASTAPTGRGCPNGAESRLTKEASPPGRSRATAWLRKRASRQPDSPTAALITEAVEKGGGGGVTTRTLRYIPATIESVACRSTSWPHCELRPPQPAAASDVWDGATSTMRTLVLSGTAPKLARLATRRATQRDILVSTRSHARDTSEGADERCCRCGVGGKRGETGMAKGHQESTGSPGVEQPNFLLSQRNYDSELAGRRRSCGREGSAQGREQGQAPHPY